MNVSQQSCEEKPIGRVVHTQVAQSVWDHRVSPNPHALAIYLELIHVFGNMIGRFDECQCEDDNVHIFSWISVPSDGHYHWLKRPINSLSMEQWA